MKNLVKVKGCSFSAAVFVLLLCFNLLLAGCSSGGGGAAGGGTTPTAKQPVSLTPGTDVIVTTKTIGATGGIIEAGSSGTSIDGVTVQFPAGALSADTAVSLGYNPGTLIPNEGIYAGIAIILTAGTLTQFDQPVTITVPFTDMSKVPVPYYVDTAGKLHPMHLIEIDRTAKTFTFQTFHASLYTWIFGDTEQGSNNIDTGYSPSDDGFQIGNKGNAYNREGECFGMTSFSLWYFMNKKVSKGKFYPKYYDIVGTDFYGNSLRGQDIIATRAFTSISQEWNTYYKPLTENEAKFSDEERYVHIRNIIANVGPALIYLYHKNTNDGTDSHSILAYAINGSSGTISVYDPNHPNESRTITYNKSNKTFDKFSTLTFYGVDLGFLGFNYDGITLTGDGSLHIDEPSEPYQNILDDADENFQGSGGAVINLTSHISGQQVSDRNIILSGTIENGEILVTKLIVFVGSTRFAVNVADDGTFSLPVSLGSGINHLVFRTEGLTYVEGDHNNLNLQLFPIKNNMATKDFTVDLNVPKSVILVTLTWDTNDTDIDTYVIDPVGDYSCYYHKSTADGGELDYDITTGYGPEHWTLMTTDTVRYDQPYIIRLHYFSDHGNGPSNYTVSIKVYEGTSRVQEYWYRGNLAVSNSSNDSPDGSGEDWVDIANITLTQATTQVSAHALRATRASDGRINITVPVPPKEQRIKAKVQ